MKKFIALSIFLSVFYGLTVFAQNNGKGKGNDNGKETGRTNLILPHGYIGLNTLTPSERLEVVGNIKVSNSIFAHDIDVIGLSTTSFTVREDATIGRNLLVQGNVGIGIQNPAERLEIGGNLKVTQGIYSYSMETENFVGITGLFSGNLNVKQNFNVEGLTGLGIASPTERLEVSGNIKATQGLLSESVETNIFTGNTGTFTGNLSVNQNFLLDGFLGVGIANPTEKIDVSGNIRASENLISSGLQTGTGQFTSNVNIGQNLLVTGNTGLGVASPTEKLDIAGNVKASGNIWSQSLETTTFISENGSFTGNLSVGKNFSVTGLTGLGVANPTEMLEVNGNVKISGNLTSGSIETGAFTGATGSFSDNVAMDQNLNVGGNIGIGVASPTEKLDVLGNIKASGNISAQSIQIDSFTSANGAFSGNLTVGQNFSVTGLTGLGVANPTEKLEVAGNIKATQSLMASQLNVSEAEITSNLNIGGNASVTGNLTANEGLFAGSVSVDNGLSVAGSSEFMGHVSMANLTILEDFNVQNNLAIGGLLGVNVSSPQATLHIGGDGIFEGEIRAVKLIVDELEVANLDLGNQDGDMARFDQDLYVEGNVGIGTEKMEGYKLSVNGKIRASDDIKVYPSVEWADYVFEEDYKLAKLKEVENYIQNNNRLPGMPSSEQVKESGINLGEMDAKLLEKIEELTLYMIELKKENEKLSRQVEQLKKKIAE